MLELDEALGLTSKKWEVCMVVNLKYLVESGISFHMLRSL